MGRRPAPIWNTSRFTQVRVPTQKLALTGELSLFAAPRCPRPPTRCHCVVNNRVPRERVRLHFGPEQRAPRPVRSTAAAVIDGPRARVDYGKEHAGGAGARSVEQQTERRRLARRKRRDRRVGGRDVRRVARPRVAALRRVRADDGRDARRRRDRLGPHEPRVRGVCVSQGLRPPRAPRSRRRGPERRAPASGAAPPSRPCEASRLSAPQRTPSTQAASSRSSRWPRR